MNSKHIHHFFSLCSIKVFHSRIYMEKLDYFEGEIKCYKLYINLIRFAHSGWRNIHWLVEKKHTHNIHFFSYLLARLVHTNLLDTH